MKKLSSNGNQDVNYATNNYSREQTKSDKTESINLLNYRDEVIRYCQTNLRPKTTEIYERTFRLLMEQVGEIEINAITPTNLENYKNIRSKCVSKTTTNMELRTLKTIFELAVKWNYLNENPAKNLKQIRIPDKEYLRFSKEELLKILSFAKDEVFKTFILFAYYTGMRSSEICNLQWSDIDLDKNMIFIRNKDSFSTKTGKNRRIPINEGLKLILQKYINLITLFNTITDDGYVFVNNYKTKFNKDIISKRFKRIIRKAGLSEKFHFHCLRHSCLTDLVQNGVNVYNIKEIAGHSSIKTTENYLHASLDELQKSMNVLSLYNYS